MRRKGCISKVSCLNPIQVKRLIASLVDLDTLVACSRNSHAW